MSVFIVSELNYNYYFARKQSADRRREAKRVHVYTWPPAVSPQRLIATLSWQLKTTFYLGKIKNDTRRRHRPHARNIPTRCGKRETSYSTAPDLNADPLRSNLCCNAGGRWRVPRDGTYALHLCAGGLVPREWRNVVSKVHTSCYYHT